MFNRQVKLAQTFAEFQQQAEDFLASYGFPVDQDYKKLFGSFVQMLPPNQDHFNPRQLASAIRKAVANEHAFYLIYPEKRPKVEPNTEAPVESQETKSPNS